MSKAFYYSLEYRRKQSDLTKKNWQKGVFDFRRKQALKSCVREDCEKSFTTRPSDPKKFCSQSCSVTVNNRKRIVSKATKEKISAALLGIPNPRKGIFKVERSKTVCQNSLCGHPFIFESWKKRKFCSNKCAMAVIGGRPTSPRAARAKAGTRKDLGDIYFYSRWEANFARIMNFLGIEWQYQPKTFDLKTQNYTPDFYLPKYNLYIEIKNFLSPYSHQRDRKFRELYPYLLLVLLLKEDYNILKNIFTSQIKQWEYS